MLTTSRIPATAAEHEAVDRLTSLHGSVSLTRRDPGEDGPIVVELPTGESVTLDDAKIGEING